MKTLLLLLLAPVMMMAAEQTATFKVSGNCNSCKKTITKAANAVGGVQSSTWDKETKIATVVFDDATAKLPEIKQAIANAGYDVENIKATDEAYNKLHSCCKYRGKE
ncbi:hypothetical protein BH10BAC6_BH10BAC6_04110 [soil metagenome]